MPRFRCVLCNTLKRKKSDKCYKYHDKYGWPEGKEKPTTDKALWRICTKCYNDKTKNTSQRKNEEDILRKNELR